MRLTNCAKCELDCNVYIYSIKGCFLFWQNFVLIPNQESARVLRIPNSSKESEGIYTCVCTWEHHGIKHNSSGSRRLIIKEQTISSPPKFLLPINNSVVFTDVGSEVILNCSVFFGLTVCDQCSIHWEINGIRPSGLNGYESRYSVLFFSRRMDGTVQSVLTITEVSESDLRSEFACKAEDSVEVIFVSLLYVYYMYVYYHLILTDGKLYDAYVIYQRNNLNEMTSKTVSDFVSGSLLTVLESYYGFKLFIHGRDDLPGEDCINLIETEIQLSRRLIIILTSGASTDKSSVSPEAYDLQVGLHQALVQGATGVILIQLGQMRDYTHLPLGLQHLLCKNSPLLWRDGESSPNSRFWKRVRYQMPTLFTLFDYS
uniref:TIR domain-containing protein n=1 Tax=Sinocyclocheilus grahami TaxID=75366 RepID=A0A672MJ55_SINGR